MSVCWVILWVRPTPGKICVSVRWVTLWVRPPPLCENMCVRSLGYIVGVFPLCVSVQFVTLWVRPPLVCVLSLDPRMLPTPLCGIFF